MPNFALNIFRPIKTAVINKSPFFGKVWEGKTKKVSPLPTEQPKLQGVPKNMTMKVNSKPLNVKSIRNNAIAYVNSLK